MPSETRLAGDQMPITWATIIAKLIPVNCSGLAHRCALVGVQRPANDRQSQKVVMHESHHRTIILTQRF